MATISVGHLRQNPTEALREVRRGETYDVTHHGEVIARIVPPGDHDVWVPAHRAALLQEGPGDPLWLAEWSAERDRDRLEDPRE